MCRRPKYRRILFFTLFLILIIKIETAWAKNHPFLTYTHLLSILHPFHRPFPKKHHPNRDGAFLLPFVRESKGGGDSMEPTYHDGDKVFVPLCYLILLQQKEYCFPWHILRHNCLCVREW